MECLEFTLEAGKRTVSAYGLKATMLPKLKFYVPYYKNDEETEFSLFGGLCCVTCFYNDEEHHFDIQPMWHYSDNINSIHLYREFKTKFNIKHNYVHCYSADLHRTTLKYNSLKKMQNAFLNMIFYSDNYCFPTYKDLSYDSYRRMTSNFTKVDK